MAAKINIYECMFMLDTGKVAGDVAAADKQLRTLLERNHAEVLISRPWDERRLTYPIRKQKKGLFYLTYFSADGKAIPGIERDSQLSEMIMRQLIIRIEPKLVETMLSVAKGEHAVALHNIHEEGEQPAGATPAGAPAGGGEGGDGEHRPRRPRNEPRD